MNVPRSHEVAQRQREHASARCRRSRTGTSVQLPGAAVTVIAASVLVDEPPLASRDLDHRRVGPGGGVGERRVLARRLERAVAVEVPRVGERVTVGVRRGGRERHRERGRAGGQRRRGRGDHRVGVGGRDAAGRGRRACPPRSRCRPRCATGCRPRRTRPGCGRGPCRTSGRRRTSCTTRSGGRRPPSVPSSSAYVDLVHLQQDVDAVGVARAVVVPPPLTTGLTGDW